MLSETMQKELTGQIKMEWESEFYYLTMMAWCLNNDYPGFASWFDQQAAEERIHGRKFLDYIDQAGGEVVIPSVEAKTSKFLDLQDLFEHALQAEQNVSAAIDKLLSKAIAEGDHATQQFMQWFVSEQLEEEAMARDNLALIRRIKDNPSAVYLMEQQLAKRGAPAAEAGAE